MNERQASGDAGELLELVIEHYRTSGDFNGLPITSVAFEPEAIAELARLVRDEVIEVVAESDFVNPYIRPWPTRRTIAEQVQSLLDLVNGTGELTCVYPTRKALTACGDIGSWPDQPYRQRLADGEGQLELAYFTVDVIEQYRNDPRYHFWFGDFEVHFGIGDDAYLDENEADRDKIPSLRVGFAYDVESVATTTVRRFACTFLKDLSDLTPDLLT